MVVKFFQYTHRYLYYKLLCNFSSKKLPRTLPVFVNRDFLILIHFHGLVKKGKRIYSFLLSVIATLKKKSTVLHMNNQQSRKLKPDAEEQRYINPANLDRQYSSISPQYSESEYCTIKEINEQQQQKQKEENLSNSVPYRSRPLGL